MTREPGDLDEELTKRVAVRAVIPSSPLDEAGLAGQLDPGSS